MAIIHHNFARLEIDFVGGNVGVAVFGDDVFPAAAEFGLGIMAFEGEFWREGNVGSEVCITLEDGRPLC